MDFKAPYNRSDYIDFFRSHLLPEDFRDHSEDITVGFKSNLITKVVKIGEVPSLELQIYEVSHPSENDPRVSLSRDSFRLLAQYGAKRALIIFNSENSQNFRLSLVTIDLKWEEGKRVQKEYSNPRRYSFFLGPETRTHTPQVYLIKQGRVKDFDDLKGRFSIEIVNKEFYTQIAILFTRLAGGKREIGRKSIDAGRGLLNLPSTVDDTLDKEFTVRLIGRLVFCWFLKKKRSDKNIPLLPEELLSVKAVSENKGYYHGILEPLFFEVLNTPTDNRAKKYQCSPWSQIPFLNGGLFTPHLHDYYDPGPPGISKHINTLKVPDHWIKELFEVFETYNFTIDENTSVDVELSIEPEMLGRIFENLLAEINPETGETARKATGSYYTPRPIVEYMVDESLKQYLLTKTKLEEEKITRLLTYEDIEVKLTGSEKESVLNALDTIKIIDPACGSGAFPMGILQKMLLILQKIDPESEWWLDTKLSQIESKLLKKELGKKLKDENVNYVHKLGIIQSSIYGVDIQPIAVEISKLRFFLSLIVDETVNDTKENRGIEPLPNLEFKFVCANSLIGLPKKEPQQTLFEATDDIKALRDLRDDYLRSYGDEKKKIEKKFQEVQSRMFKHSIGWGGKDSQTLKLAQWNPFSEEPCSWFDPDWMFGVKEGFDVVIANPPYIGIKDMTWDERRYYEEVFKTAIGRFDIYALFIEKAMQLKSSSGAFAFIIPGKFLNNKQFSVARKIVCKNHGVTIVKIDDKVFEAAQVNSVIVENYLPVKSSKPKYKTYRFTEQKLESISETDIDTILQDDEVIFRLEIDIDLETLISKMRTNTLKIKKISEVKDGIVAGEIKDKLFLRRKIDKDSKKLYFGKHLTMYHLADTDVWVNYKPEEMMREEIKRKGTKRPGLWMRDKKVFERETIVYRKVGKEIIASYLENGIYYEQTLHGVHINNKQIKTKYVLALFNSKLFKFYYQKTNSQGGDIFPQVRISSIENLPIKLTDSEIQKEIENIVNKILTITNNYGYLQSRTKQAKVKEYERQIDQMVYDLYGLTKKETEIVEKSFKNE